MFMEDKDKPSFFIIINKDAALLVSILTITFFSRISDTFLIFELVLDKNIKGEC